VHELGEAKTVSPKRLFTLHVGQAGYIGAVSKGGGVLHFRGRNHPFEVAGAGVGGIGVTRFDGQGPVYNLTSVAEFAGPFAQVRTGLAIGFRGQGKMMLRNRNGVVMRLAGTRKGLALSTGADAMVVSFATRATPTQSFFIRLSLLTGADSRTPGSLRWP
jgi:hypothetical protein